MPIFEFKCQVCEEFIELLVMNKDEEVELNCPKCKSRELERVLSTTNFNVSGANAGGSSAASTQTRTCSGGSCTTYNIPGPD